MAGIKKVRILRRFLDRYNMKNEDDFLYDDDESVKFIKKLLPDDLKQKFDDDDIIYIVDLIYEFYDSKGLMDIEDEDDDKEIDFDEDELIDFVVTNALADGINKYKAEDVEVIVKAELDYCESIGMFE